MEVTFPETFMSYCTIHVYISYRSFLLFLHAVHTVLIPTNIVQIDVIKLEEVCTNKDEELQVARAEVEQLPILKKAIVKLQVRKH